MMRMLQRSLWIAVVLSAAVNAPAQSRLVRDLALGKLLVAPKDLPDPSFAQTVILLVQFDKDGAVGLMINRRTKIPISRALAEIQTAQNKSDPMYVGGPVELNGVLALLRAGTQPRETARVTGDVYLAASRAVLEKTLAAGTGPAQFRVYLGYCGWAAGQLQNEVDLGGWYIFSGTADLVFDSDPATLWTRLIARTEQRIARNFAPQWTGTGRDFTKRREDASASPQRLMITGNAAERNAPGGI
jgi:putative AlgH/UPF0301 family transcriptional regulator